MKRVDACIAILVSYNGSGQTRGTIGGFLASGAYIPKLIKLQLRKELFFKFKPQAHNLSYLS